MAFWCAGKSVASDTSGQSQAATGALRRAGLVILALSLLAVWLGTIAPAPVMGWLREHVPGFAAAWDALNALLPGLNPLHALAYAWMALLWALLVRGHWRWKGPFVLLAIGTLGESIQAFVPTRTARASDVLNDLGGIVIGLLLAHLIHRLRRRGSSHRSRAR